MLPLACLRCLGPDSEGFKMRVGFGHAGYYRGRGLRTRGSYFHSTLTSPNAALRAMLK